MLASVFNCPTLTASVGLIPAATLVMRRSAPADPTETVLGALAMEPAPRATEFAELAATVAPAPRATEPGAGGVDDRC